MQTLDEADGLDGIPLDVRDDWRRYLERTVNDLWRRPALPPTDRSLITVAALVALRCPTELERQARAGLEYGVSRLELCETVIQVSGYAGLGVGVEGFEVLSRVFGDLPEQGDDPGDLPRAIPGTRVERARIAQGYFTEHIDAMFATRIPYPEDVPAEARPPFHPTGKEWSGWLTETAFGDLWSRPNLSLRRRELVTATVLIVLGRRDELRSHLEASLRFGISPEEMAEALVHLAVYAGFPAMVGSMVLYAEVLAAHGLPGPTGLES